MTSHFSPRYPALHHQDIPVRHMKFDFRTETMAKYCWRDDAFSSAFILTFSALIPHGETLVIEAVRAWRDQIKDPQLKARVSDLIGQEAMHSRVHQEFNKAYQAKGLPMDKIDRAGEWFFTEWLPSVLDKRMLLAVTCAIEHFTALMAEHSFAKPENSQMLDDQAREFLLWHLLEECEHKSVAFDVYQEVVGNHWMLSFAMIFIIASSGGVFAYSMRLLLATPGFAQPWRKQRRGFEWWFGKKGYFFQLQPNISKFFRRDFHPDQIDTEAMLLQWRENLFGNQGVLAPKLLKITGSTQHAGRR